MQLRSLWINVKLAQTMLALLALYVSGIACATTEIPSPPIPHIALLLPLNSQGLGTSAQAVHQGILAAAGLQSKGLPVRVYSDYDEAHSVTSAYKAAIAGGAVAVVGPLTRSGISRLANEASLPVPTLALNIIEGHGPAQLYFFGMAVEAEARQIAQLARKQGMQQAIVITSREPLAQRLQFSFEEQWTRSGGAISREIEYNGDTTIFADIEASPAGMVFFATNAEKSRAIRPYLPNNLAAYGTSQLFAGNKDRMLNFDFDGVRFVDMPWLMREVQTSVTAYPRANPPLATDLERLYALGIDTYRLINILIKNQIVTALPLEGVTGRISLNGQTFDREALPAIFVQGHAQSADAPVTQAELMFPDQFRNTSSVIPALPVTAGLPSER